MNKKILIRKINSTLKFYEKNVSLLDHLPITLNVMILHSLLFILENGSFIDGNKNNEV